MKKFVCKVCGYVYEGENPPEVCPQCKAKDAFIEQTGDLNWACEHVIGVGKEVDPRVVEGLKANFEGECTEVGMYLAMSRQAIREGYPEIGEFYRTAALEEAEHAAKFAELLGEVVYPDTESLERFVGKMQKYGKTQTQIVFSTAVEHRELSPALEIERAG